MKSLLRLLPLALVALALPSAAQEARPTWTDRTLELFATMPVQDGGRVKPLDTWAQFRLLRFNGKRTLQDDRGQRIGPTHWLLDCLFFPEVASTYRAFLVRDQAVLTLIGVDVPERKKSDRYSYAELLPGRAKLFSEAQRIGAIEPKQRNYLENQVFVLAENVRDFGDLVHSLDFTRVRLSTHESALLRERLGAEPEPGLTGFLAVVPALREEIEGRLASLSQEEQDAEHDALETVSEELAHAVESSSVLAVFPPTHPEDEEWQRVTGVTEHAFAHSDSQELDLLRGWEELERAKGDPAAFETALTGLHLRTVGLAERRGEYGSVPLELRYYKADFFTRALVFYLLGFLFLCVSWIAPRMRWPHIATWAVSSLATVLVVVGIVMRCIIQGRPPVMILYDTILFITACTAILLLVLEWIQRGRLALAMTPILGAAGLFLAMKYELKEAVLNGDTMTTLVAVLDTNFWLSIHVTTVTLGYAAALLAAAFANLWLLARMVGFKRSDPEFFRSLARTIYGIVCFGLSFSVFGTITGGIWANYSWGRFWGWDPKENGALLICLAELLILHARMGGYVKSFGVAALSALNGMVVAFSWWHVNNLGVGLHSYGKTEGVLFVLYTYYFLQLSLVLGALVWRALSSGSSASPAAPTTT